MKLSLSAINLTVLICVPIILFCTPYSFAIDEEYRIRQEDELEIFVWQHQDLTRRTVVDLDGNIYLPLIDRVYVVGLTPTQVAAKLRDKYGEYIKIPEISVIVSKFGYRVVYILGEVGKPGQYSITKDMQLMQLISIAGSLTVDAISEKIQVYRRSAGTNKPQVYTFDFNKIVRGEVDDFNLSPGDVVYVPRSPLTQWNMLIAKYSPTFAFITSILALIFIFVRL